MSLSIPGYVEESPAARLRSQLDAWPAGYAPWKVSEYIREEVKRQGHNLKVLEDGGYRVRWMTAAWEWAVQARCDGECWPTVSDIQRLGQMVEPEKNAAGFRAVGVRCGLSACPPADAVLPRLAHLTSAVRELPPLEWYREFELIHPFRDGNGRSGKILLNWLAGTLADPRFPPADLFGHPILNP